MKPRVSIIVPVYNVEPFLRDCLDSLRRQTLKEIEVICVNDGSTDNSRLILEEFAHKDGRFVILNQKNKGRSAARNVGLKHVHAEYVMFCDSDDQFSAKMCQRMVRAIEESKADLAACGLEIKYEAHVGHKDDEDEYYRIKFKGTKNINDEITSRTDTSVCNKIFRSSLIKENKIDFPKGLNNEDFYFYNVYMSVAKKITFIEEKLYKYIRHEGSIMSMNYEKQGFSPDHLLVAIKLFSFYKQHDFLEMHKDLFWRQFVESYWFSYTYTSKDSRKKIDDIAKEFITNEYKNCRPSSFGLKLQVKTVGKNNFIYKVIRRIKGLAGRVLRYLRSKML